MCEGVEVLGASAERSAVCLQLCVLLFTCSLEKEKANDSKGIFSGISQRFESTEFCIVQVSR